MEKVNINQTRKENERKDHYTFASWDNTDAHVVPAPGRHALMVFSQKTTT